MNKKALKRQLAHRKRMAEFWQAAHEKQTERARTAEAERDFLYEKVRLAMEAMPSRAEVEARARSARLRDLRCRVADVGAPQERVARFGD